MRRNLFVKKAKILLMQSAGILSCIVQDLNNTINYTLKKSVHYQVHKGGRWVWWINRDHAGHDPGDSNLYPSANMLKLNIEAKQVTAKRQLIHILALDIVWSWNISSLYSLAWYSTLIKQKGKLRKVKSENWNFKEGQIFKSMLSMIGQ